MSFDNSGSKPNLVENKMISRISKIQKIMQEQNITWSQQVANNMCTFIANNIISLIIIVLIIIVLIYRYYDVQEKKKNKSNNTTEEETDVIE
jgi:predicted PurR-regulated permease PerM